MSAQTKHENYWGRLIDKDLSEGFHSFCKKCNRNMDNESGDVCKQCEGADDDIAAPLND